jgi:hypothetical protein
MARRRASMREGPLAELFRATEGAQEPEPAKGTEAAKEPERPESTADKPHLRSVETPPAEEPRAEPRAWQALLAHRVARPRTWP